MVHFWNLLPRAHCGKVTLFRFSSFFMFIMAGCCHRGACLENLDSYLSRIIESSDSLSPRSQGFSKITLPPAFVISFAISTDLSTSKLALSTSLCCAELSPSHFSGLSRSLTGAGASIPLEPIRDTEKVLQGTPRTAAA